MIAPAINVDSYGSEIDDSSLSSQNISEQTITRRAYGTGRYAESQNPLFLNLKVNTDLANQLREAISQNSKVTQGELESLFPCLTPTQIRGRLYNTKRKLVHLGNSEHVDGNPEDAVPHSPVKEKRVKK